MKGRGAIIVRCSQAECDVIHEQARVQRRSISGYVLRVALNAAAFDERSIVNFPRQLFANWKRTPKVQGPRTTFLVRCAKDESDRIRTAAMRRGVTMSGFVLTTLWRVWKIEAELGRVFPPPHFWFRRTPNAAEFVLGQQDCAH